MKHNPFTYIILIFLSGIQLCTYAQSNNLEAKMAYQMAEEKFVSQNYQDAIDFLCKAEKALGRANPPMAYLKVMITDQLAYKAANKSNGLEMLHNLKIAVSQFETTESKEMLGEDKLMEIYRIKMGLEERKATVEKWHTNFEKQHELFEDLVMRLSKEYPKTDITVAEFLKHPQAWNVPNLFDRSKVNERMIERFVSWGESKPLFYKTLSYNNLNPVKLLMYEFKTKEKGIDNIDDYVMMQFTKQIPYTTEIYEVSYQQVAELLKIPDELSMDALEGSNWIQSGGWYSIFYTSKEKKQDGEPKKFEIHVLKEMVDHESQFGKKRTYLSLAVKVTENTL